MSAARDAAASASDGSSARRRRSTYVGGRSAGGVVASVAVLTASLVGCTSNAEPSTLPTPTLSASPSASPSPSATPPTMPAEAEGTSPRAAKAFVRYWVDALNYATTTGDTAPVDAS